MSAVYRWDFALRLIVVVAALNFINCLFLPWDVALDLMREGGPIENTTVLGYYFALAMLWLLAPQKASKPALIAISVLLLACAARELDLHKALFGMSILKANFYRHYASGAQIAGAVAMLLPVFASMGYLWLRYGRWLRDGVKRRDPVAVTTASLFALLFFVKILDRSLGVAMELGGYNAPLPLRALEQTQEEPLEMILPLLVVLAAVQAWYRPDRPDRQAAG